MFNELRWGKKFTSYFNSHVVTYSEVAQQLLEPSRPSVGLWKDTSGKQAASKNTRLVHWTQQQMSQLNLCWIDVNKGLRHICKITSNVIELLTLRAGCWIKFCKWLAVHICKHLQKFIQHPALKDISICEVNCWGSSVWLSTQQFDYWSYIYFSTNPWEKMGIQWRSSSAFYRFQESLWFS